MKCCCAALGAATGGLCSRFLGPVSSLASLWPMQPAPRLVGRQERLLQQGWSRAAGTRKTFRCRCPSENRVLGCTPSFRMSGTLSGERDDFRPFTEKPREGGLDLRGVWLHGCSLLPSCRRDHHQRFTCQRSLTHCSRPPGWHVPI